MKSLETCCFTGYRPSKLPFDIGNKDKEYIKFENSLIEKVMLLINNGCSAFYSGMAMGFDIIAAETVLLLKKQTKLPIKLICVLPFKNQKDTFYGGWKEKYDFIIDNCDEIIVTNQEYYKGCYQKRNKYMVEHSDCVLTWFDGKAGGTKNTLDYANKIGRKIINLNEDENNCFSKQMTMDLI